MDFKICIHNGLLYDKNCQLNEYLSTELVSIVFLSLLLHRNNHTLQELRKGDVSYIWQSKVKTISFKFNHESRVCVIQKCVLYTVK